MSVNIAIDGPSGAGKSSTARALAQELGYLYIDTGALYRAIGLYCADAGVKDLKDAGQVAPHLKDIRLELRFFNGTQQIFLNDRDVSQAIRTQRIAQAASDVSSIPAVREFLLDLQRDIARENNVIMDGRDIGTVILPNAAVKFFLTADDRCRARRRVGELRGKGIEADEETVLAEIRLRDRNDSTRAAAPLKAADDAVRVDNTGMDIAQTVAYMRKIIEERTGNAV